MTTYTYPGVYVEEIPSGVRTIAGVSTSNTAFVDFFPRGPINQAQRITSFSDFERSYGGLDIQSEASYAIQQFYLCGGQIAFVVRAKASVVSGKPQPSKAQIGLLATVGSNSKLALIVEAIDEGLWGNALQVAIDWKTAPDPATNQSRPNEFNLVVREVGTVGGRSAVLRSEIHRNLSMDTTSPRYAAAAVEAASQMIRLVDNSGGVRPDATATLSAPSVTDASLIADPTTGVKTIGGGSGANPSYVFRSPLDSDINTAFPGAVQAGDDGALPDAQGLLDGLAALDTIAPEMFNILSIPRSAALDSEGTSLASPFVTLNLCAVVAGATKYCSDKRAFFIVDIPEEVKTGQAVMTWLESNDIRNRNAAVYFPRLEIPDPLNENRPRNVAASGTLAGLYAATDASRGVWKAPAGTDVALTGATLPTKLTDLENGGLNPYGINALRTFPVFGNVVWGARTLDGADIQASEWKYIPVRRTALFIEESLYQGLKWVVFEPNDEPLWAQIRLNVGAFMHNLFRRGAFQGTTPSKAYLVKCDSETTTQNDIDLGVVNILVGFAPLKPAEFVVIRIQQLAGQVQA